MSTSFKDCATALMLTQPFFATLLMKFKHVEDAGLRPPTLAVSADTIYYHPDFFSKRPDEEGIFGIAHEIMHAVYEHLPRMRHYIESGLGPDGKKYDHQLMNVACDYPINDSLFQSKVGKLIAGCHHDPRRFPHTMLPEEVYCILAKERASSRPKPGSGPSGQGAGAPTPGGPGDEPGEGEPQPGEPGGDTGGFDSHIWQSTATVAPAVTNVEILEAANIAKATRGSLPAGVERLIGEFQKPVVSPWRQLRQFVASALRGFDQSTWKRLQRHMIVRGIGMPGSVANGAGHIGIVADTSGSIDAAMLQLFAGHMAAIIDDAKPQLVSIYWVDAKVHRVDKVRGGTQLRSLLGAGFKAPGGGGTDMPKGVTAALRDKCDAVVVLTDGYTPFGDPSPKPVVWAITTPGHKSPHGKTVHIN